MARKRTSHKRGMPPGTLVYVGEEKTGAVRVALVEYNPDHCEMTENATLEQCTASMQNESVSWIQVMGVHDVGVIEKIGTAFNLHPLVMEDLAHTSQRPKLEDYEDQLFIVLRSLYPENEQIGLVVGRGYIISFQEHESPLFDPVKGRINAAKGRIRKSGSDYLCYALVDTVVDSFFHILEAINERLDGLQEKVLEDPSVQTLQDIQSVKEDVFQLRRSVWPLREIIGKVQRNDAGIIGREVEVYFRDVQDHAAQLIETAEGFREILSGILDIHLSGMSNKMNEIMRVLTVIATIFIPLTFLAGVYGMNFKYMPELDWPAAYPLFWVIIMALGVGMAWWFRKRGWF